MRIENHVPDPQARTSRLPIRPALPSLNFLGLLLLFTGTGALLWNGLVVGRFIVFVFVLSGWVVSLCLHEFGHAATAYLGGDKSITRTGYLDLDPARYADPMLSLVLPVLFILIGGIGLPGGAVFIDHRRLRGPGWAALVSAAGPVMNVAFLLMLAGLYALLPEKESYLGAGLGALALFQATAIILNLLPIPGLDGFGIIRPFLPTRFALRAEEYGAIALLIFFLLLWLTKAGVIMIRTGFFITQALGFDPMTTLTAFGMLKLF